MHIFTNEIFKGGVIEWMQIVRFRLTNTRFHVLYFTRSHCKAHLMITSRIIDTKRLKKATKLDYFFFLKKSKNTDANVSWLLLVMSPDFTGIESPHCNKMTLNFELE